MVRVLLSQFDAPQPDVDYRRCLRSRQAGAAAADRCTICRDACPQGAVSFRDGLRLEPGTCIACGVCAAACPTEAISHDERQFALLEQARAGTSVAFGCRVGRTLGSDDRRPWDAEAHAVCGLSWRFIAAAALQSATRCVLLDCRNCTSCTHGAGRAAVASAARRAAAFLAALGIISSIEAVDSSADADDPATVSRRQFFRTIMGRAGKAAHDTANRYGFVRSKGKSVQDLLWNAVCETAIVPKEREPTSLAGQPGSPCSPGSTCSPWGSFTVSADCSGCGECATACPRQAWSISSNANNRQVAFDMQACRDCGYCVSRCPQDAIRRVADPVPRPLQGARILATVAAHSCRRCRKSYPDLADGLCRNCAKQAALV